MRTVIIQEAKTHLSRLSEKAFEGEEIHIARGSEPVARLVALSNSSGQRQPGNMKGRFRVGPEFFDSLPDGEH
jgi:antitoxin (DNA-binding transcriptional repressor) of toxin-antitoxin stability system